VHADYNWGNLLVDDGYENYLVDFANSAVTKGLVVRPAVLLLAFWKGDANLVLKKLTQIGEFGNLPADRARILADIEATIANYDIKKRSWPKLALASWREWRALKNAQATQATRKMSLDMDDLDEADETVKIRMNLTEARVGGVPSIGGPRNVAAAAGLSFAKTFAKMSVGYPYHRVRVAVLRSSLCQRLLGSDK
jgi:predicted unusual protein kinase regulating ubiquinone biosynthesis (AarF/ABC1/UbiB family)